MPSFSHQGTVHLKLSLAHNKKKEPEIKGDVVPDSKKTNAEADGNNGSAGNGGGGGVGGIVGDAVWHSVNCDDGVVFTPSSHRSISGDIKVKFYAKHVIGKSKLFSFWFNTYFVCEKRDDGTYQSSVSLQEFIISFHSICIVLLRRTNRMKNEAPIILAASRRCRLINSILNYFQKPITTIHT